MPLFYFESVPSGEEFLKKLSAEFRCSLFCLYNIEKEIEEEKEQSTWKNRTRSTLQVKI